MVIIIVFNIVLFKLFLPNLSILSKWTVPFQGQTNNSDPSGEGVCDLTFPQIIVAMS